MPKLAERIIEKILQREVIPSSAEGYYFALAHDILWWELMDQPAVALKTRGLVTETETEIWSSDKTAAKSLKVPVRFVQPLWDSGDAQRKYHDRGAAQTWMEANLE
ncbi:MAG: hypothetical protein Q9199_006734 [Rusavskia elegans]